MGRRRNCVFRVAAARRGARRENERSRHAADRPARAPARLRPAPAVPADDQRHEARIRVGDRQRGRRAGLGSRRPPLDDRADGGATARQALRRQRAGLRPRRAAALHTRVDALALAPAPVPALRAPRPDGQAAGARPEERLLPRRPLRARAGRRGRLPGPPLPRQLRRLRARDALRRAGNLVRLHRPLSAPLPRPEPGAARPSGRRLRPRAPREPGRGARGARLLEQRRLDPDQADLARRNPRRGDTTHAARRATAARARCRTPVGHVRLLETRQLVVAQLDLRSGHASSTCSTLVAPTIGAVTPGLCRSQASATCAGRASRAAATSAARSITGKSRSGR